MVSPHLTLSVPVSSQMGSYASLECRVLIPFLIGLAGFQSYISREASAAPQDLFILPPLHPKALLVSQHCATGSWGIGTAPICCGLNIQLMGGMVIRAVTAE